MTRRSVLRNWAPTSGIRRQVLPQETALLGQELLSRRRWFVENGTTGLDSQIGHSALCPCRFVPQEPNSPVYEHCNVESKPSTYFRGMVMTKLIFLCRTWILTCQSICPTLYISYSSRQEASNNQRLVNARSVLCAAWDRHESRQCVPEEEWIEGLTNHLETIVNLRIDHVRERLTVNLSRFQAGHASIEELRRTFENAIVDLKGNVQLCKSLVVSYSAFKVAPIMVRIIVRPTISVCMNVISVWNFLESISNVT
ncbi:hypothetical protein PAXRUDRAFT_411291 [Paxillus rubicundulus Ve08.2h10]|uniref:Uncharacterized protein n=1 Tax=Paxillus rubicundulus Ve08.2h10 TaxID=930991 RepID=A0A0D0C0I7_9AGAM|nr:hypothetical protein PAXRUDRAFT_411291 [Paxillus rubicundulus Ve08.2h10]